jgi:hypothetical protein
MGGIKEPHHKYIRKPSREDDTDRAQSRDDLRLKTEALRLQRKEMLADHGTLTDEEHAALVEKLKGKQRPWRAKGW